jgi:SAM-dependent methyltransferase
MTDLWSERAEAYRTAVEQASGSDLDRIVEWVAGAENVLDVATGGGHVARRLREAGIEVTTLDPAPGMRPDVVAGAEEIPFEDSCFDVVVTRIAPHHFADVRAAVREMARVACDQVIVEDTLYVSEEVEAAERLRDPTHVRSYTEDEWRAMLEDAGLRVEEVEQHSKRHPLDAWLARTGCEGEEAERVRGLLAEHIDGDDYVDIKLLLRARKDSS